MHDMTFFSVIHDKAFCLSHPVLVELWAIYNEDFHSSHVAQDIDILKLNRGWTALLLAEHSPIWLNSPAADRADVQALRNGNVGQIIERERNASRAPEGCYQ